MSGVLFFGDSVLAGTGASARELGCAKLVKGAAGVPVSLRARNWNTSIDALNRLEGDVLRQSKFAYVVVLFGNNDCWLVGRKCHKVSLDQFCENMITIADRIKANGQVPLLCNLQPIDQNALIKTHSDTSQYWKEGDDSPEEIQQKYSAAIEDMSVRRQLQLVNIRRSLKNCTENVVASDGLHPNDKGHSVIANEILVILNKQGLIPKTVKKLE
jgi:lysophospholipase L1-like esterase